MFLNKLSNEKKELFLSLAFNISHVDGTYSHEEKYMLEQYCIEMDINLNKINLNEDFDYVLDTINKICDSYEKKIIVFEAIGLILADGILHDKEKNAIINMIKLFGINEKYFDECKKLIIEYYDLQARILNLVN